ncbi:MAG: UvrB/UvrC motif-containing protein [Verrucomicrobiales bacterium]|nr:UvrB/UvrC motif-containing protein [Verrucomicrobiales bacterium]
MRHDLTNFLRKWDYQPGELRVRRLKGRDGREKVQLRVDLGVLQMEVDGRPDGKRPMGHDSWLQFYQSRLGEHIAEHGDDAGFDLKIEDCQRLQQEAIQYYHRYICFFQLGDHPAVLRDTERNLEVFALLEEYAESSEITESLTVFKPQVLLMRTRAQGALALEADDPRGAITAIETGVEAIRRVFRDTGQAELAEQSTEVKMLESWLQELRPHLPLTRRERLETELNQAISREDYEKAAELRDALKRLKDS